MDPILVLIAASTLVTAAIGIFAVTRTNRLRTQLEDRVLMLEMELSTVRRDLLDASAREAASEAAATNGARINGFIHEPRNVEILAASIDADSEPISTNHPSTSTALAVAEPVVINSIAEMVPDGNDIVAVPPPLHPQHPRSWEPPPVTELAVRSGPFDEQVAMNSLAKVGVALLVLGVASLPWRPSNRLNPTR
ncbi:hypothetical protein [Occallatibacter riparius]|uniref:Uncharacterized protein n=1 Tax=Occallatibacter riparius TaxID=1002689 RepID=A0A9J7BM68_9BACT|nr:hypothetical protein [Occallatibacter riparius]UWZ83727.1 hypothetical protein MOP44_24575 [Occallatibacter riparius]